MIFFQRMRGKRKIKSTLESLSLFKTSVKDMGSLDAGIEFLNDKFDMIQYLINSLNRDLMEYTGKAGFLDSEIEKLSKLRIQYLDEKQV